MSHGDTFHLLGIFECPAEIRFIHVAIIDYLAEMQLTDSRYSIVCARSISSAWNSAR